MLNPRMASSQCGAHRVRDALTPVVFPSLSHRCVQRRKWSAINYSLGKWRISCRSLGDVESYCAKYVCKERAWWWYQLSRQGWASCPLVRHEVEKFSLVCPQDSRSCKVAVESKV